MNATPLVLPRISKADVNDARARSVPRAPLPVLQPSWQVRIDAARKGRIDTPSMTVDVTWGKHKVAVRCASEAVSDIVRRLDPDLDVAGSPPDIAALLIEAALLPALIAAERAIGGDIRVIGARLEDGPPSVEGLPLLLSDGKRTWGVHVDAPHETVTELLSAWPVTPHTMDRLPLPAVVRIGTTRLTIGAVRSLRPGDAVLLEVGRGQGGVLIVAASWLADAEPHEDSWMLASPLRPARSKNDMEWTMQNEEDDPDDVSDETEPLGNTDDLPVRLAFDVGRLEITLGELRRLDVESILELGRSPDDLVRISAGGKLVGQGTLMDVDGKVAVRIVRMFDHG